MKYRKAIRRTITRTISNDAKKDFKEGDRGRGGGGRKKLSLVFEEKSNEASRNSSDEINEKYYEDI